MAVGLAVVARALGPVLLKIGPMLTDWMAKNGASALDSMLKSPQRRAWRAYAAAVITGTAASVTEEEIPALCQMASEIADEMVRREAERAEAEDE